MKKRQCTLLLADIGALILSLWLARYLGKYEVEFLSVWQTPYVLGAFVLVKILVYREFSLYKSLWEFASIEELMQIFGASALANSIGYICLWLMGSVVEFRFLALLFVLDAFFVGGIRFSYRIVRRLKNRRPIFSEDSLQRILIIGAGSTAGIISKEIRNHPREYGRVIGFVDDASEKQGVSINGVRVLGTRYDIYSIVRKYKVDQIIFAVPSATGDQKKEILSECKRTGIKVKTVPGIQEIVDGKINMNQVRDMNIEDLLGRESVSLDMEKIQDHVRNRVVLVTGGGGSIGSELCRQIANFSPRRLVILDIYENNAYDIENELKRKYESELELEVIIASVRDRDTIFDLMESIRPDIVFHAAAHKHVPLMEKSPKEAVKNNVFGTLNVAEAADTNGVRRFVLVSTDKAVNPTNVMGATKNICEMIIQVMDRRSKTKFVGVRFGNVLGSNGSVIPLFRRQIKEGGPVTVTHKEIIRYFMTIPEAAQLVIQAGAMASGGEIFVLDMGEPVRIADLAEDLIRLSGFRPYEDIDIVYTGLRCGEKLYEELLLDDEIKNQRTTNEKIFIGSPPAPEYQFLMKHLDMLHEIIAIGTDRELKDYLEVVVPTYTQESEKVNKAFEESGWKRNFEQAYKHSGQTT